MFSDSDEDDGADKKPTRNETEKIQQTSQNVKTISPLDIDLSYLERQDEQKPNPHAKLNDLKQANMLDGATVLLNDLLDDIYPTSKMNRDLSNDSSIFIKKHENNLSKNAIDLLEQLPNLNFMKSKILVVPIGHVSDKLEVESDVSLI